MSVFTQQSRHIYTTHTKTRNFGNIQQFINLFGNSSTKERQKEESTLTATENKNKKQFQPNGQIQKKLVATAYTLCSKFASKF